MARAPGDVRNDRKNAVSRFCLTMEEHRRTEAGRVRTAREMVDFFFPRADGAADDRIFLHIPPEVRGPIISGWGIRGAKSAVRDTDDKVRQVVADALAAGDVDEATFEEGVNAQTLVDWTPLTDWWSFWRTGKLTGVAIQKALAVGRELGLFDDRWFLLNLEGRGGKLKGTDTLCDTLSKDQIIGWMRKVHESGDGSPAGLVGALGWETILSKTSQEALLFALDALARKLGLVSQHAMPTEMPGGSGDDVAVPEIPGLDPPRIDVAPVADRPAPDGPLAEARAAMMSSLAEDVNVGASWPAVDARVAPAQSGTMLSADEAPLSFRDVEADTAKQDKPKAQPPPVPSSSRKGGAR
ncbi:MAG: hypothetical protein KF782_06495 [Labilithrix sp.]|nr:hypothetical protein [Labilithrix sp.]